MAIPSLSEWENPYLTVQQNMATLHLTQADANPSQLGTGGVLRLVAARRQDLTVRLSDLPAASTPFRELLALWPRGCHRGGARHANRGPSRGSPQRRSSHQNLGDMAWWSTNGPNPAFADFVATVVFCRCLERATGPFYI